MPDTPKTADDAGRSFPGVFLLSLPRTGSTLLRLLLDSHPRIYAPDELNLGRLLHAIYLTAEGLTDSDSAEVPDRFEINPASPGAAEARRIVGEMLGGALAARGKSLWCDKSPSNVEFLPLLERIFPAARYLILHRHPLDFALSCLRFSSYGFFLTVVEEYVRKDHRNFLRPLLQAWNDKTAELIDFERRHAGRALRVRYEDLVAAPQPVMEKVFDFLGVEPVPDLAARTFASPHHQRAYHGDAKAFFSAGISDRSVGSGAEINVGALRPVPAAVLERMNELVRELAYPPVEITERGVNLGMGSRAAAAGAPGTPETSGTPRTPPREAAGDAADATASAAAVEAFFAGLGRRLTERGAPASLAGRSFAFEITGPGGCAWTLDLSAQPPALRPGTDGAGCRLAVAADDFAAIVAGRLNPALAVQQGKLRVDGESDPLAMRDLIGLVLAP